ncbi:MAG: DUF4402 domain-containing protein [Pseudomonadota bacterium]|nr:DUF4402 domain-containing protein [Pseudomonadota bacterium]
MLAGLFMVSPSVTSAQSIATAEARVTIQKDVSLTKTRDMDFGRVVVPTNGRIDMSAEETATCTPNNGITLHGVCQSAQFVGSAGNGAQMRISVPAGRRIELTGPDRELRLRRMTVGAGNGLSFIGRVNRNFDFSVTDPNGDFEFYVGARLLFRNNQAPGVYSGTFDIEVDYQ